jgi:hypothetical protein
MISRLVAALAVIAVPVGFLAGILLLLSHAMGVQR